MWRLRNAQPAALGWLQVEATRGSAAALAAFAATCNQPSATAAEPAFAATCNQPGAAAAEPAFAATCNQPSATSAEPAFAAVLAVNSFDVRKRH